MAAEKGFTPSAGSEAASGTKTTTTAAPAAK